MILHRISSKSNEIQERKDKNHKPTEEVACPNQKYEKWNDRKKCDRVRESTVDIKTRPIIAMVPINLALYPLGHEPPLADIVLKRYIAYQTSTVWVEKNPP